MAETVDLFVPLAEVDDPLAPRLERALGWARGQAGTVRVLRRSLDARKGRPLGQRLRVLVARRDETLEPLAAAAPPAHWPGGRPAPKVVVVGSGPAGSWAALRLAEAGVPVTIVEQGRPVQPRRRDLALLTRGQLTESSNYCFGEGGAGTYSDGKLYTRAEGSRRCRRGDRRSRRASARPTTSRSRRARTSGRIACRACCRRCATHLVELGVEYRFEATVAGLRAAGGRVRAVRLAGGDELPADVVVLAVGHSARPVYRLGGRGRDRARAQAVRDRRAHRAPAAPDRRASSTATPRDTRSCRPRSTS